MATSLASGPSPPPLFQAFAMPKKSKVQCIVRKLEDYGVPEGNILGIRSPPPYSRHLQCQETQNALPLQHNPGVAPGTDSLREAFTYHFGQSDGHGATQKPRHAEAADVLCPTADGGQPRLRTKGKELGGSRNLTVVGHRYGFKGFYDREHKPVILNRKYVEGLQLQGGTILGTSRYVSLPSHSGTPPPPRSLRPISTSSTVKRWYHFEKFEIPLKSPIPPPLWATSPHPPAPTCTS